MAPVCSSQTEGRMLRMIGEIAKAAEVAGEAAKGMSEETKKMVKEYSDGSIVNLPLKYLCLCS